jgi:hypothetical protein
MCLSRAKNKGEHISIKREDDSYVGWKVFIKRNRALNFVIMPGITNIPVKTWIHEKDYRSFSFKKDTICFGRPPSFPEQKRIYPMGFHIYVTLASANKSKRSMHGNCIVKKVYFKQIVQRGYQDETPVIVAKQIFICGRL